METGTHPPSRDMERAARDDRLVRWFGSCAACPRVQRWLITNDDRLRPGLVDWLQAHCDCGFYTPFLDQLL